jgi:hypothetical protein
MLRYFAKSALLLGIGIVIFCGVYPGVLWLLGQTLFPYQANGSIVRNADGAVVGSMLVATSSAYAPSNYALRDRVARNRPDRDLYCRGKEGPTRRSRRRGLVSNRQGRRQSAHRRAMGRRP